MTSLRISFNSRQIKPLPSSAKILSGGDIDLSLLKSFRQDEVYEIITFKFEISELLTSCKIKSRKFWEIFYEFGIHILSDKVLFNLK